MKLPALLLFLPFAAAWGAALSLPVPGGAEVVLTGGWKTPQRFGSPEEEASFSGTLWTVADDAGEDVPPSARLDPALPEIPAPTDGEGELCAELVATAARLCEELNELNRRVYDLSSARASAAGQEFRGIPLTPEEAVLMNELRAAQFRLAGEAQEMAFLLAAVETEAEARGCVFDSCHRRNLDPSVESAPHYLSRENAAAVYHVQVAPWRPVRK